MLCLVIFVLNLCLVLATLPPPCPSLPGQLGPPADLNSTTVNLVLDSPFTQSPVYLIRNGVSPQPFDSFTDVMARGLESLLPANHTAINITGLESFLALNLSVEQGGPLLHYTLSLRNTSAAVTSLCADPQWDTVSEDSPVVIDTTFSCNNNTGDTEIVQGCLTVGTEPFNLLNGTYHTFTFFFPVFCSGPTSTDCAPPSQEFIANMCVSPNQSLALVQSGAGSWPLLSNILREGHQSAVDGYCFVDEDEIPPGIVTLLRDPQLNENYAIPEAFDVLEVYLASSRRSDPPFSFSVEATAENITILGHPMIINGAPHSGVTFTGRVDFVFSLPCNRPGLSRVFVNVSLSNFQNGIIYSENYPMDLYFHRNCTPDAVSLVGTDLGLAVGLPLSLVMVLLIALAIVVTLVTLHFTRRHRRKLFLLEQEQQLQYADNTYMLTEFENAFDSLRELNLEYNYASLEVVGSLGEGAFGRVFKAYAPGLKGDKEYVAVKTLKEGADLDVTRSFVAEVKTSAQFDHPNVVKLIGMCTEVPEKCMIFEYMDMGSLNDVLRLSDPTRPDHTPSKHLLSPQQFLPCCVQVAKGLAYLAFHKFVHRDIATRNCLMDSGGVVKIADFGMSREVSADDYYRISSAKACLPVRWMPPEALLYGKFTVKSDVWSYGVLMWEVYTYAHQPFGGVSNYEVIDWIKDGRVLECPDLCPASVYDIMKSCWTKIPQCRPTMASILKRITHLYQSSTLQLLEDDYTAMGPAEGYMNLAFGTVAGAEELEEKKRVEAILEHETRVAGEEEESECEEVTMEFPGEELKSPIETDLQLTSEEEEAAIIEDTQLEKDVIRKLEPIENVLDHNTE